mmetsp:Transcript_25877/g.65697  ORF Transcript_25877/g.65697 Transcript_25877/m.65697 type:complete len:136 (+) Transcript_25877:2796-3203(+)
MGSPGGSQFTRFCHHALVGRAPLVPLAQRVLNGAVEPERLTVRTPSSGGGVVLNGLRAGKEDASARGGGGGGAGESGGAGGGELGGKGEGEGGGEGDDLRQSDASHRQSPTKAMMQPVPPHAAVGHTQVPSPPGT